MNIVILTGAGISAESGLGTFRDKGGLWSRYRIEEVATPEAYESNPEFVHEFYNLRREACRKAVPNAAHLALAALERVHEGNLLLVTQNVDDLHQRAGSRSVVQMHGHLLKGKCTKCGYSWHLSANMSAKDLCPSCQERACRPDVVWFGEEVRDFEKIRLATERADIFALIGSSGRVSPAAELMAIARECGAATVEMNLEPSATSSAADRIFLGHATTTVPIWVADYI